MENSASSDPLNFQELLQAETADKETKHLTQHCLVSIKALKLNNL